MSSAELTPASPKGPRFDPLLIVRYLRDPVKCYQGLAEKFGDPFTVPFQGKQFVITGDPDGVKDIFTASPRTFGDMDMGTELTLGENSLLVTSGEAHERARRILNPAFGASRMSAYGPLIEAAALEVFSRIPAGQPTTAMAWTQLVSMEVILKTVLGIADGREIAEFVECFKRFQGDAGFWITFFPFLRRDLGAWSPWRRFTQARQALHDKMDEQIAARRKPEDFAGRHCMLAQMARRKEQDPDKSFTDAEIRDHLFTILMAGHESAASGLAWGIYWLHRHPEIRARLLAELDEKAPPGDFDALAGLPYLDAVCKETLRIHPVIPDVARRLAVPFSLKGHRVEAGSVLVASVNLAHHRPDLYPEPDRFRPERFLERSFSQYEYFPFGGGGHYCLGRGLGMLELKIGLAAIIRNFELDVDTRHPVRPAWNNAVRSPKGGVKMTVRGRRPA